MDVDIKLSRSNNQPWGIRLSGGEDFSFPLTVVRVTIGGSAHKAGLQAGDIVIKLNGETISHLRHNEFLDRLLHTGNDVTLTVARNYNLNRPKKE